MISDAHVDALLRVIGPDCRISHERLHRSLINAHVRYLTVRGTARQLPNQKPVKAAWGKLDRLAEQTIAHIAEAEAELLSGLGAAANWTPGVAVPDEDFRELSEALERVRAIAAVVKRRGGTRLPGQPAKGKADLAMDRLTSALMDIYTEATGERVTFTTDAYTGETGGTFVEFASIALAPLGKNAPKPNEIRNRVRALNYGREGLEKKLSVPLSWAAEPVFIDQHPSERGADDDDDNRDLRQ